MKIWIINHYFVPPTQAGGTRHYSLAKALKNAGHEVLIIAANFNHFTSQYTVALPHQDEELLLHEDIPVLWLRTPSYHGNRFRRMFNMASFGWRVFKSPYLKKNSPDLIIASTPHLFAAFGGYCLAKRLKTRFFVEVRDLWPETLVQLGKISTYHPIVLLFRYIEKILYKKSEKIITLLPAAHVYIQKYFGASCLEKIVWLPNFIDSTLLPDFETFSAPAQSDAHKPLKLIYAGAHGLANDLMTLIDAAIILKEEGWENKIQIECYGEGPQKSALIAKKTRYQLDFLNFYPAVAKKEIYSLLNKADAFIFLLKGSPLFDYGISPNKLFDYMVVGRPIIFSVNGILNPEQSFPGLLPVKPSSPEDLAQSIKQVFNMSVAERQALGHTAREYVKQHHEVSIIAKKLEDFCF